VNTRGSWARALGVLACRALFTVVALHLFGILWRPLLLAAVALVAAAVVAVVLVVSLRQVLLRRRGW
jgi:hypothetical protein